MLIDEDCNQGQSVEPIRHDRGRLGPIGADRGRYGHIGVSLGGLRDKLVPKLTIGRIKPNQVLFHQTWYDISGGRAD